MDIGRLKLPIPSRPLQRSRDPGTQDAIDAAFNSIRLIAKDLASCAGPVTLIASEGITKGQAVTILTARAYKANKDAAKPAVGVAIGVPDADNKIQVMLGMGYVSGLTGLVAGNSYYLGTAGAIQNSIPGAGLKQSIGFALSATELFVTISQPF